jgi:feruloyl esterase
MRTNPPRQTLYHDHCRWLLQRFLRAHGGKIIHYVGWADSAIAPINSVNYYDSVRAELAGIVRSARNSDRWEEIQEFYRLFMVPGMAHCSGGDGPNAFGNGTNNGPVIDADHDLLKALERWVEQDVAPDRIIATHYVNNSLAGGVQFQRPLCSFPQVARFTVGDSTMANSFKCVMDEPDRDPRD